MSFTKEKRIQIKIYILEKLDSGDQELIKKTTDVFGISDKTVYRYLQEMVNEGILIKTNRQYALINEEFKYHFKRTEALEQGEDFIYSHYILKHIADLKTNLCSIWDYGFTEIMNNAIDHSESDNIRIIVRRNRLRTSILIIDDGIGIFEKIKKKYQLQTVDDAVNELFKGKLTTDPDHHSGEGIFFTSRLMDYFAAVSCGSIFTHNKYSEISQEISVFGSGRIRKNKRGTLIYMSLSNYSNKNALDIFNSYASIEGGFTKTSIPLKNIYDMPPVARSQAKRLVRRLGDFEEVILDFEGMEAIGQGFAHELFVVFQNEHKNTRLIPINSNEVITKMIAHVLNTR